MQSLLKLSNCRYIQTRSVHGPFADRKFDIRTSG